MINNKICALGLGYVGLPLAHAFSEKYSVVGFDRTLELNEAQVKESLDNGMIFTRNIEDLKNCNIYIVTVPTPIGSNNEPDLTSIIQSTEFISKVLKQDDIVNYESTVYPGVAEEIYVSILEDGNGLVFNQSIYERDIMVKL